MSDELDELGRSVTRAVRFLRQFHRDVAQLLEELDALLGEQAWRPTEKGRVSYDASNAMSPYGWLAECLFRFYVPASEGSKIRTLVGFVVRCDPAAGFDQPVLLGAGARFDAPTNWTTIYQGWKSSEPVIEGLAKGPGPRLLTVDEVKPLLPGAARAVGLAVPLCRMGSPDVLRSVAVDPILKAVAAFPP